MKITYLKTLFKIKALEELNLPYFKGSTFRGVFGNTFKKIACVLKTQVCEECILKNSCVYSYIFETPPPSDKTIFNMSKYKNIPHPFIIEPPENAKKIFAPEDELIFSLILIGKAKNYLPYFIYTFTECGKKGIGKGRGRFTLKEVLTEKEEKIYTDNDHNIKSPTPKEIEIREDIFEAEEEEKELALQLITPIRLRNNNDLVTKLEFYTLIKALTLRLNLIHFYHCEGLEPNWDYKKILDLAKNVKIIEDKTRWWDWERYSTRQKSKMKLGGLIGTIRYRGKIGLFKDLLEAGEILHIGKNTTFGLGKYKIITT